jgi:hypothetical protein
MPLGLGPCSGRLSLGPSGPVLRVTRHSTRFVGSAPVSRFLLAGSKHGLLLERRHPASVEINESLGAVGLGLIHVAASGKNVSKGQVRFDISRLERCDAGPKQPGFASQTMARRKAGQIHERGDITFVCGGEPGAILGERALLPLDFEHAVFRHADCAHTHVDRDGGLRLEGYDPFETTALREVKDIRLQGRHEEHRSGQTEQQSCESKVHGKPPNRRSGQTRLCHGSSKSRARLNPHGVCAVLPFDCPQ